MSYIEAENNYYNNHEAPFTPFKEATKEELVNECLNPVNLRDFFDENSEIEGFAGHDNLDIFHHNCIGAILTMCEVESGDWVPETCVKEAKDQLYNSIMLFIKNQKQTIEENKN